MENSDTPLQLANLSREELIHVYFIRGLSYDEILNMLSIHHGITLSKRHLHRLLRDQGLSRRINKSNLNDVFDFLDHSISETSSKNFGYRQMTQRLRGLGYVVDRETVRMCIKELDPEGVLERSRHRLVRRTYVTRGPNYLWHMDGYDKLKPYGFCIHGAIDGFSRKILWLKVGSSNNDPRVVASYFINCIRVLNLVPRCIRADRGSENVMVCGMQRYLRRNDVDSVAGNKSFMYGTSTSNQRIEAWWSIFKKSRTAWWINYFKDAIDQGIYDPSLVEHKECMKFSFMNLIQNDLDETKLLWNNHRIRKVRNSECPNGKPDILYFASGQNDFRNDLFMEDFEICQDYLVDNRQIQEHQIFINCGQVMIDHNLQRPTSVHEAIVLFRTLLRFV